MPNRNQRERRCRTHTSRIPIYNRTRRNQTIPKTQININPTFFSIKLFGENYETAKFLERSVKPFNPISLDVGCGKHKRGDIGIDIDNTSVADVIADAEHLPFANNVFSKIVSVNVIEHSPNPLNFLKEQYRVLKNNGIIKIQTDNANYYRYILNLFGQRHAEPFQDHHMIFYPINVERLLKKAGFQNIVTSYIMIRTKLGILLQPLRLLKIIKLSALYPSFEVVAKK